MKALISLLLFCYLTIPLTVMAETMEESGFSPKDQIEFSASSKHAFDRTGNRVIHLTLPDGSLMAKHNGSLENITVARRRPDGKLETFCTTDIAAAKAWMAGKDLPHSSFELNLDEEEKIP